MQTSLEVLKEAIPEPRILTILKALGMIVPVAMQLFKLLRPSKRSKGDESMPDELEDMETSTDIPSASLAKDKR